MDEGRHKNKYLKAKIHKRQREGKTIKKQTR